ncbi:DUF4190 domain-containing protein [uncultured Demequina sp.]|uniref:DUF4190 domain-containing protein n=1 Tax=uncultured Demequina sp. TaxID=693499 RepID=UPI0025F2FCEE|nr:DUF4190 domain-containing protein [uncultured Demequina sp.]
MSTTPEDPFARRPADAGGAAQAGEGRPAYPPPDPGPHVPHDPQPGFQQQYAQPGLGQPAYPPQYAYPGTYRAGTQKNWMGIISLVLSLVGLLTWFTAIPGIVFGHLGLAAAKRGEANNRGLSLGGLITGYVVLVLGILATIAIFAFFAWGASQCGGDIPADWCTSDDGTIVWEFETT